MVEIISFKGSDKENLALAHIVRTEVFVNEQHVDSVLELDQFDEVAQHYLLFIDHKAVGTARWRETEEGIRLERFAVIASERRNYYGQLILDHILADLLPMGKEIYLHAQIYVVDWYKDNGFETVGEHFLEAGVEHVKMILTA